MKIVLGSQSEGRKKVLEAVGLAFEVVTANIDEKKIRYRDPRTLTLALANAKADAILPMITEPSLLITADQVVVWDGEIREKAENMQDAIRFLTSLHIHPSETVTAVVVTDTVSGVRVSGVDVAKIWFTRIDGMVMYDYIRTGDPYRLAGGFDHEHPLLVPFVLRIEGEKESITGLPITLTRALLNSFSSLGT